MPFVRCPAHRGDANTSHRSRIAGPASSEVGELPIAPQCSLAIPAARLRRARKAGIADIAGHRAERVAPLDARESYPARVRAVLEREWPQVLAELFALFAELDERAEAPEH